jgi:hypothetical protein
MMMGCIALGCWQLMGRSGMARANRDCLALQLPVLPHLVSFRSCFTWCCTPRIKSLTLPAAAAAVVSAASLQNAMHN